MTEETAAPSNPYESPREASFASPAAPLPAKLAIADLLFCTFAVAAALMLHQPWGGFDFGMQFVRLEWILLALSASVFFTANRLRLQRKQDFFSFAPGHLVALIAAGEFATIVFQYLVSFLEPRHVGMPIHLLAHVSRNLWFLVAGAALAYLAPVAPRWRAYFISLAALGLVLSVLTTSRFFSSPSDQSSLVNVIAASGRFIIGLWVLCGLFLLISYLVDLAAAPRRDGLHHAGVLLQLVNTLLISLSLIGLFWYYLYFYFPNL